MPQVVSFMNMKGGVGKTTLAVNVAYGLASLHKKNVLLVDADPQFNATQYLLDDADYLAHINDPTKGTLYDIFVPRRPGRVNTVTGKAKPTNKARVGLADVTVGVFDGGSGRGKLDIVPSILGLMEIETSKRGTENKLKRFVEQKAGGYDYVLIDCPPTISIFTQAAILASDRYLVPIKPDPLSIIGLPLLERWLEEFTEDAGIDIELVGLVFTLVTGPTPARMKAVMDDLRNQRKDEVFEDHLSNSTTVAKSVEDHQPVFRYARNHKTAKQLMNITREFLNRTGE